MRIIVLLVFSSISFAQLPENIEAFIESNYPNARYPDHEMFKTYWKWFAEDEAKGDPYFVIADFNGDGLDDCAILLNVDSTLHLVALNQTKSGFELFCIYKPIQLNSTSDLNCGVFVEPPGELVETLAGKTRELEVVTNMNSGIHLKFFEQSSIYY